MSKTQRTYGFLTLIIFHVEYKKNKIYTALIFQKIFYDLVIITILRNVNSFPWSQICPTKFNRYFKLSNFYNTS